MTDRIAQVLYSGLGGHGNVAISLVHAAKKAEDPSCHSMIFVGIEPVLPSYMDSCKTLGLSYRSIKAKNGLPIFRWVMLIWHLLKLRPNIILLHSVKMIIPAKLYALLSGARLIAIEHQANELKKPSEWRVSQLVMRFADKVILLTEDYAAALEQGLGSHWCKEKTAIIPNGIDTDLFAPRAETKPTTTRVKIGMASRLADNKRHDTLIDGFSRLCTEHPDRDWLLSIAGDGETRSRLVTQISDNDLSDKVTVEGFLGPDQLLDWFRELDIYVHASDGETLSTSVLQALAMGLPIVGSNVAGISNLLSQNGGCGIIAKDRTAQAFADALNQAASNNPDVRLLGNNARALALSTYSQNAMFQSYKRVMDSA